jgi:hypothetical protein
VLIELNGLDLSAAPFYPDAVTGVLASPEVRAPVRPRLTRDGTQTGPVYLGGRTVALTVDVVAWSEAELQDALGALSEAVTLTETSTLRLELPGLAGGATVRSSVRVSRWSAPVSHEHFSHASTVSLELVADDPRFYSDALQTVPVTSALASDGFTFPATFPLTFGSVGSGGTAVLTNPGNYWAPFVVTIPGPVTRPRITHMGTGRSLAAELTVADGDTLTLDTGARTVTYNGVTRYGLLSSAEWFDLSPGTTELRFAVGGAAPAAAIFSYRPAWV